MTMFYTRDSQLHDLAADDAYRSYLISRNQQPIVFHSRDVQWKQFCVAARLTRKHINGFFAAIRAALVADKMRRAQRELALRGVRYDQAPRAQSRWTWRTMSRDHSAALFARIGFCASAIRAVFRWLWAFVIGPAVYRPDAHYMRGPGPKCREKDRVS